MPSVLSQRGAVKHLGVTSWMLSLLCFGGGLYIGMSVHAHAGAGLWAASAFLALAPFASHRNNV